MKGGVEGGTFLRQGHRGYFGLNVLSGLWHELKGREWRWGGLVQASFGGVGYLLSDAHLLPLRKGDQTQIRAWGGGE